MEGSALNMARQILKPGQPVDFATTSEIGEIVAESFARERSEMYRRVKNTIQLDASGAGTAIEKVSRLYDWVCERVTLVTGPNATVQFYQNQIAASDMIEVVGLGAAGLYSDSFSNCMFVEAGSQLYIVVTAGGANGFLSYNIQTRLLRQSGSGGV